MEEYNTDTKRISFDINRFTVEKTKGSLWSDTLDLFLERLNPRRKADGYRPYSHGELARKLSKAGYDTGEKARTLYDTCNDPEVRNFSMLFHWKLKEARRPPQTPVS